jgi:hypothetical protein
MTGPDYYRLAEQLLTDRGVLDDVLVGTVQVHARLVQGVLVIIAVTRSAGYDRRSNERPIFGFSVLRIAVLELPSVYNGVARARSIAYTSFVRPVVSNHGV